MTYDKDSRPNWLVFNFDISDDGGEGDDNEYIELIFKTSLYFESLANAGIEREAVQGFLEMSCRQFSEELSSRAGTRDVKYEFKFDKKELDLVDNKWKFKMTIEFDNDEFSFDDFSKEVSRFRMFLRKFPQLLLNSMKVYGEDLKEILETQISNKAH